MNAPYRVQFQVRTFIGYDPLGNPKYSTQTIGPIGAHVEILSMSELPASNEIAISTVSIRVTRSAPILASDGKITVLTGPHAGQYNVKQVRPNRNHTRYLATLVVS